MLFVSDVHAHALPGQRTQISAKEFFSKETGLERRLCGQENLALVQMAWI